MGNRAIGTPVIVVHHVNDRAKNRTDKSARRTLNATFTSILPYKMSHSIVHRRSECPLNLYFLCFEGIVGFDNSRPPTEHVTNVMNHELLCLRSVTLSE